MTNASTATIDPQEAAHFGTLAADWWDPNGTSAMLHKLNPARLAFIRDAVDTHWHGAKSGRSPLAGKTVLDVGCGAGLVCEPLTRLGGTVTGLDAAPENIAAAQAHAAAMGLGVDYRCAELATVEGAFDLVTCLEVIEHVADPAAFIAQLSARLAEGGLLIMSTPNRTPQSRIGIVLLAEGLGLIPRGTHDWRKFLTPDALTELLLGQGLNVTSIKGIAFSPMRGLHLSDDKTLNYILTAHR